MGAAAKLASAAPAPSDHPEFARFLTECGIDSISVNPDSFERTKRVVAEAESEQRPGAAATGTG
jgi:pyruvate, water dikinase